MNVFINEVNYFSGTFSRCYHCMYCVFNRKIFFCGGCYLKSV